jgi:hypothetical protein
MLEFPELCFWDCELQDTQNTVAKMDFFTDWATPLSTKAARVGYDGVIELESAGLTFFEFAHSKGK